MTGQRPDGGVAGHIPRGELAGGIDLFETLASGQTYRWHRVDGDLFDRPTSRPTPWYATVAEGEVVRVREREDGLEWHASADVEGVIRRLLRLDDDLDRLLDAGPSTPVYREAVRRFEGMRLVRDTLPVALVSFICSTNMRVDRIHDMVQRLSRRFGDAHRFDGRTYHAFPTMGSLARASEADLRGCGVGYRAPYLSATAGAVVDAEPPLPDPGSTEYPRLRDELTAYHGVGPKVADCAVLFGVGRLEAVPLDRWIRRAIERHFPDCARGSYEATSRAIRDRLGPYPGYAQTYLFHHLRTRSG